MKKAILEFDDERDLLYAVKGLNYLIAINDLDQWLRDKIKYKDVHAIPLEDVRDKIREVMGDNSVSLEDLK